MVSENDARALVSTGTMEQSIVETSRTELRALDCALDARSALLAISTHDLACSVTRAAMAASARVRGCEASKTRRATCDAPIARRARTTEARSNSSRSSPPA
eukprot:scaffold56629_cov29-Tisochrysis_lutea.AAC.2